MFGYIQYKSADTIRETKRHYRHYSNGLADVATVIGFNGLVCIVSGHGVKDFLFLNVVDENECVSEKLWF